MIKEVVSQAVDDKDYKLFCMLIIAFKVYSKRLKVI
jgi:hypothetical protein